MANRFRERLEQLPPERRLEVLQAVKGMIQDGVDEDRAFFEALRQAFHEPWPREPVGEQEGRPEPSRGVAPGPVGVPHSGGDGRDPLPQSQGPAPSPDAVPWPSRRPRRRAITPRLRHPKRARNASERRRRT